MGNLFGLFFMNILLATYLFLPAYIGNIFPVLVSNLFKKNFSTPVDFGKKFKKEFIFGKHKTWRGIFSSIIGGHLIFLLQKFLFGFDFFQRISLINYDNISIFFGAMIGFGAILGDLVESFLKRRLKISSGTEWFPFDQLDYILGGLVVLLFFYIPRVEIISIIVVVSFILHLIIGRVFMPFKNSGNNI